ncbi:MAG: hypothetical protein KC433_10265 [Anaerolineales bacterium]|nr:hypothetical protein [Anaerolineales bacterium]MCB8940003.1 hypothetical protein [Ardenticatenaceae bacterium]
MKRFFLFLLLAVGVWFTAVACGSAIDDEAPTPTPVENIEEGGALNAAPENSNSASQPEPDVLPRATLTPPPVSEPESASDGYPAPAFPSPTPLPEGYVAPPPPPPLDPYPEANGTLIWIIKPVGTQCAEAPATPDLQTAVADMVAFGIPVEASEMIDLAVCTACDCPTSAHFRLQIDSGYLGNAEILGWVAEE